MKTIDVYSLSYWGEFQTVALTTSLNRVEEWKTHPNYHVEKFIVEIPQEIQVQRDY